MKNLRKLSREVLKNVNGGYQILDCSKWEEQTRTMECIKKQPGFISCISYYSDNAIGCNEGQICLNGTCVNAE